MTDAVTIRQGRLTARIEAKGAQLTSLTQDGAERMWQADPTVWAWHAPNLFPIVGGLKGDRLLHKGESYTLPSHGFLRHTVCDLTASSDAACTWRLTDSEATLAVYPFRFELEIAYAIEADALIGQFTLANPGDEPLIASLGIHPAFQWPLEPGRAREDYRLRFERAETTPIRRVSGKLIASDSEPTPIHGRELDLNYSARPLAQEIQKAAPEVHLVAVDGVKRDMVYGLAFYRNEPMVHYAADGVPDAEHLLVTRANDTEALSHWLTGRIYVPLFLYESQGLEVYKVYARSETPVAQVAVPSP